MKKLTFCILFLIFYFVAFSQEEISDFSNGFSFPLGSRVRIELAPTDSTYVYRVLEIEAFEEIIDVYDHPGLFPEKIEDLIIEIVFCVGTRGETDEERGKNLRTLMLLKSGLTAPLEYSCDIAPRGEQEFTNTSVVMLTPQAKVTEMWPYIIDAFALYDFRPFDGSKFTIIE